MTGLATGPHLHFSFYDRETYIDPLSTKLPRLDELAAGQRMDRTYLNRVMFTLKHYQQLASHDAYNTDAQ